MRHNVNILAADIGGTHARFAHLRLEDGILRSLGQITYRSAEIVSARDVVRRFLAESGAESDTAALAVAGPVTRGRGRLTNLGLEFDQRELAGWLGLGHATVLNDFEALGFVLPLLDPEDFIVLHHGDPDAHGVMALLGAGTGLGQALVRRSRADGVVEVAPTEGGHSSFAARNETEWALQRFLAARYDGHVSWERVVSGPGLAAIYEFLVVSGREPENPETRRELARADPPAVVVRRALERSDRACEAALEVFVAAYGARAGDVALSVGATGGVYLAGGMTIRVREELRSAAFLAAFLEKGRMRSWMERIPVRIIERDDAGIIGAALAALPPSVRATVREIPEAAPIP